MLRKLIEEKVPEKALDHSKPDFPANNEDACFGFNEARRQILDELDKVEFIPEKPYLGLATTRELLDEIRARIEVFGELNYRTIDS